MILFDRLFALLATMGFPVHVRRAGIDPGCAERMDPRRVEVEVKWCSSRRVSACEIPSVPFSSRHPSRCRCHRRGRVSSVDARSRLKPNFLAAFNDKSQTRPVTRMIDFGRRMQIVRSGALSNRVGYPGSPGSGKPHSRSSFRREVFYGARSVLLDNVVCSCKVHAAETQREPCHTRRDTG
jgi:hypothetical protein